MHVDLTRHRTASYQVPSKLVCQLGVDGAYNYELVVVKDTKDWKENPAMVYVTDHAEKIIYTAGASGTATILAGKLKASSMFLPDGDNSMKGIAKYAATPDMKAVISITQEGKPPEQTCFMPMGVAKDGHIDHPH
jgi:hypothetical protein